nr:9345_t:CDS:2 [Entrophospora candida]
MDHIDKVSLYREKIFGEDNTNGVGNANDGRNTFPIILTIDINAPFSKM